MCRRRPCRTWQRVLRAARSAAPSVSTWFILAVRRACELFFFCFDAWFVAFWVGAEQPQQTRPESTPAAPTASTTPPREKSPAREEPPAGEISPARGNSPARGDSPARGRTSDPPETEAAAADPATGKPPRAENSL